MESQARLDFERENADSEVQPTCQKRYKMLVRVYLIPIGSRIISVLIGQKQQ